MVPPASLCFDCVPHLISLPFCGLIAVFGLALWALNCTVLAVRSLLEVLLPATLRSTVVTRFIATMMALTPARHLLKGVLPHGFASLRSPFGQPTAGYLRCAPVPVFTARSLPDIRPPTTPTFSTTGSVSPVVIWCANASGLRLSLAGSPFCCGRIVFIPRLRDCRLSGSIRCSPPRLTATQLLQVLTQNTVPDGRGLPPRRIVTLHSALGGGVTPAVLPHHRTCGSASGG